MVSSLDSRRIVYLICAAGSLFLDSGCSFSKVAIQRNDSLQLPRSYIYSISSEALPNINAVLATRRSGIWAAADRGKLLHSEDDGRHWQGTNLRGIDFLAIAETETGTLIITGREGMILRSTDYGASWSQVQSRTSVDLFSIVNTPHGIFAAGASGTLLRSDDDGRSWRALPFDKDVSIRAVASSRDGQRIYLAGRSGRIYRSANMGKSWERISNRPNELYAIWTVPSGDVVIAVGSKGLVLRSEDYGEHWRRIPTALTVGVNAVTGLVDASQVWAAASDGVVLASSDRGGTWRRVPTPTNRGLLGVTVSPSNTVIIAGYRECVLRGGRDVTFEHVNGEAYRAQGLLHTKLLGLLAFGQGGTILSSQNGGKKWQQQNLRVDVVLNAVAETRTGSLWVVGEHGLIAASDDGSNWRIAGGLPDTPLNTVAVSHDGQYVIAAGERGLVIHSEDGGRTWSQWTAPGNENLYAVAIEGTSSYFAGAGGTYFETDLKVTAPRFLRTVNNHTLRAVVVEPQARTIWLFGAAGTILKSQDHGASWDLEENDLYDTLVAAACLNNCTELVAVGGSGTIAHHRSSDDSWGYSTKTRFDLRGVASAPDGTAFVLASDLTIFHPPRIIANWESNMAGDASDGVVLPNGVLLAVGDAIWSSADDGANWQKVPAYNNLNGIVSTPSGSRMWAVGRKGLVLESTDSGHHWNSRKITAGNLLKVRVIGDKVWAVGEGDMLWRSSVKDGSWTAVPPPPFFIYDIAGDAQGHELWAAGSSGRILHSSDSGGTWVIQEPGTAADFNTIIVLRNRHRNVMAAGDGGNLAISHDGGEHWRVTAVAGRSLFSFIQVPVSGQLWLAGWDGTLLISDDEGETWNAASSGTTNDIFALSSDARGERIYGFGARGAFRIFNLLRERWRVESVHVDHTLTGLRSTLVLSGLPLTPTPTFTVRAVRIRERDSGNRMEVPAKATPPSHAAAAWQVDFSLDNLNPHAGETFDLEACVTQGNFARCIPLSEVTAVPWIDFAKHKTAIFTATALLSYALLLSLLLFIRPLTILWLYRRAYIFEAVEKLGVPGAGFIKFFLSATLVPFFAFHRRTVDAWGKKHLLAFRSRWTADLQKASPAAEVSSYIPLPIEVDGDLITTPGSERLLKIFAKPGVVEILGPGGIGKTTLLKQLATWIYEANLANDRTLTGMLPVFVEPHQDQLTEYLRKKVEVICGEDNPAEFALKALKQGRIIPFIDAFSELTSDFRSKLMKEIEQITVRSLIISTREEIYFGSHPRALLRPKPLDSKTLLYFITTLLSHLPEELSALNTMGLQLDLGTRIVHLLNSGSDQSPLTPLLARLYVERAIDLIDSGKALDELPRSIGEAYLEFVQLIVRTANISDNILALALVKILAKASLGDNFLPGRFNLQRALDASGIGAAEARMDIFRKLLSAGLLGKEDVGLQVLCQFALDPVAEFCAAYSYAEECGFDTNRWRDLIGRVTTNGHSAKGFKTALFSIVMAYSGKGLCTSDALQLLVTDRPEMIGSGEGVASIQAQH